MTQEELRALAEAEEPRAAAGPGLGGVLRPGGDDVTEILFVRHGQMPATHDTRTNEPLTDIGLKQADTLGRYLSQFPLHAIYSSPLLRTLQTAEGIARHTGLTVTAIDDLREIELYVPEGQTWDDIRTTPEYKELTERFSRERRWEVYGDLRETGASLRKRLAGVLDEVIPRHKGERIVLVTHGPIVNAAVAMIADSPYDSVISTSLTGVTIILASEERRRILTVNSRAHFGVM